MTDAEMVKWASADALHLVEERRWVLEAVARLKASSRQIDEAKCGCRGCSGSAAGEGRVDTRAV